MGGVVAAEDRNARFRAYLQGAQGIGIWIVTANSNAEPVGLIVLNPHKDEPHYEISYEFHPDHWGNGFAKEATSRVIAHVLHDTPLKKLVAETQIANHASIRLLRKLDMLEVKRITRFETEQVIMATRPRS